MNKKNIRKIYITLLFALCIALLPFYLGQPQQMAVRTLILAFGVDKAQEGYEVSAQVMVPESTQSGYKEKREVRSCKGSTIDEVLAKLQLKEGKRLAVSHANILVISENAIGDDINLILDYFVRDKNIGYMTIATTPDKAKDLLEISAKETADKDSLLRLVSFNNDYIYGTESTLKKVLFGYYSPCATSVLSRLKIAKADDNTPLNTAKTENLSDWEFGLNGKKNGKTQNFNTNNATQLNSLNSKSSQNEKNIDNILSTTPKYESEQKNISKNDKGSLSLDNQNEDNKSTIDNDGSLSVFKKGRLIKTLQPLEYRGFHWLMPIKKSLYIGLNNINDKLFSNADVIVDIVDSKDNLVLEMSKDNKPLIKFKTKLKYQISSVQQSDYQMLDYAEFVDDSKKSISKALQTLIESEVQKALQISKEYQIDVWNIYDKFYQKFGARFLNYLDNNEGDYLKDLQIFVNVSAKEKRV